jgi:hypothetical protein
MDKRKFIEIASRIYGLYLLIQIPLALSALLSVFSIDHGQFVKNPFLYKSFAVMHPVIYLAIAICLIFKAEYISKIIAGKSTNDDNEAKPNQSHMSLSFWITLLGLYFLIDSSSSFIRDIIRHPPRWGDSYPWSIIISHGMIFCTSIYMILRSNRIEQYLQMKSKGKS